MTTFRTPRSDTRFSFTLSGDLLDDDGEYTGEEWSEVFRCLPALPAGALDKLGKSVAINDAGEQVYHRPSVLGFIRDALPDKEAARFDAFLADKHRPVTLDTMGEVMKAINAHYNNGRPTTP